MQCNRKNCDGHLQPICDKCEFTGWIKVSDRLPPFGINTRLLFVNGKNEVTYGYAYPIEDGWDTGSKDTIWINDMDRETNEVATYWMTLPALPE